MDGGGRVDESWSFSIPLLIGPSAGPAPVRAHKIRLPTHLTGSFGVESCLPRRHVRRNLLMTVRLQLGYSGELRFAAIKVVLVDVARDRGGDEVVDWQILPNAAADVGAADVYQRCDDDV